MTIWIGLTGGIGSGKSQAAAEFLYLGVPLIDADAISRQLTAPNGAALPAIREVFGDTVFDKNACLKREALRNLVFSSGEAKNKLEALMYPLISAEISRQQALYSGRPYGVVEIPLLTEKPAFRALVDRVLLIDCELEIRLERVMQRSGLKEEEVRRIMDAQASDKERWAVADDILRNSASVAELKEKIGRLHRFYQSFAKGEIVGSA
ncbi:dephospho-CoA kinase [Neisseria wadsworthii]|uniref:dephospho-CoA kinase n=1 Tax=Neisseria wadsworthii TaxID=607711 RepID=UPI000D2FDB6F|nr:dephospho-CoA kinase [Neisseria wadsworthii]